MEGLCQICGLNPGLRDGKCNKCYIKFRYNKRKWIPFNKYSWKDYESFRQWQYAYDRKKVKCEVCGKEMLRTSIYRHRETKHKRFGFAS